MSYIFITFANMVAFASYYRIASHFNIVDRPNDRSSHDYVVVRGAGIIFWVSSLVWAIVNFHQYVYFGVGLFAIGLISFLDDIHTLPNKSRFLVQVFSVFLALFSLSPSITSVIVFLMTVVLYLGWINAFNFMDGINGITAFYSLSLFIPLYYLTSDQGMVTSDIVIWLCISLVVFAYLNARPRAIVFCGDVGSVVLAYVIGFILIGVMIKTQRYEYIMFGAIYGIDSIGTIIIRLLRRENIFQAHRSHLYQLLTNELGINILFIAAFYSILQLLINMVLIAISENTPERLRMYTMIMMVVLILGYSFSRLVVERRVTHSG